MFLRQKCSDNVLQCGSLPHAFALEVFAGTGRIVSSLLALGIPAYPIDICIYPDHDVLHAAVEHRIFNWIRKKRITFVWCGMPCTTFSRARKLDGLGLDRCVTVNIFGACLILNGQINKRYKTVTVCCYSQYDCFGYVNSIVYLTCWKTQIVAWLGRWMFYNNSFKNMSRRALLWITVSLVKHGRNLRV